MWKINSSIIKVALALTLFTAAESQAVNLCDQVWTGTVERVRVQEQANGETVVRIYIHPANNADYAGYTTSEFMVNVLLKGKANDVQVTGYTDSNCKIKWVDFR